jgi:hypothetical protein
MTVAYQKRHRRQVLAAFLVVTFILSLSVTKSTVASFSLDSDGLVKQAEESVTTAFKAVLDAEAAGANVSGLIVELNQAVGLLSEAKIALGNGDFDGAAEDAASVVEVAEQVRDEASSLRASALVHRDLVFNALLVGSSIGVSVFLVFMWFLWRWFKGYYVRRVLGLKPEVVGSIA